jgi:RHS repeat-associated protein
VRLMDQGQAKLVDYTYQPYGASSADTTNTNAQQFTGRENDNPGNTHGLYHYRARYYMPGCARFISEDPIGWASGQTNNYAYVAGNPVSSTDPYGTCADFGQKWLDQFNQTMDTIPGLIAPTLSGLLTAKYVGRHYNSPTWGDWFKQPNWHVDHMPLQPIRPVVITMFRNFAVLSSSFGAGLAVGTAIYVAATCD